LTVRSFPELRVLRKIAAPMNTSWAETACFARERIVAQVIGGDERTVALDPDGVQTTLDVGDGFLVGAADDTWLMGTPNAIERWTFTES
jgi:hypothetical protein